VSTVGKQKLYERREARLLLSWIINGHERIEPTWNQEARSYAYPELDKLFGNPVAPRLLEELATEGLLERYPVDNSIVCPQCHIGDELHDRYLCLFCDSSDLQKGVLIEHYNCGHVDFAPAFSRVGDLVCPKCSRSLKLIGTDYRRVENVFRCGSCKKDSSVPKVVHVCARCNAQFNYEQASLRTIYGYKFVERFRGEVVVNCTAETSLADFLREIGYSVEAPRALTGASGVEHAFDIVGERDNERIVAALVSDVREVDEQTVINYFAKVFDVRPNLAILIAMPALTVRAKRFADLCKIQTFEGKDLTEIMKRIRTAIEPATKLDERSPRIETQDLRPPIMGKKAELPPVRVIRTGKIEVQTEERCRHCGAEQEAMTVFCDKCGTRLR
jgi:hypothetical protein